MTDGTAIATATMAAAGHEPAKGWQSTDLLPFNDAMVRFRTMNDVEAGWHMHVDSGELFIPCRAASKLMSARMRIVPPAPTASRQDSS